MQSATDSKKWFRFAILSGGVGFVVIFLTLAILVSSTLSRASEVAPKSAVLERTIMAEGLPSVGSSVMGYWPPQRTSFTESVLRHVEETEVVSPTACHVPLREALRNAFRSRSPYVECKTLRRGASSDLTTRLYWYESWGEWRLFNVTFGFSNKTYRRELFQTVDQELTLPPSNSHKFEEPLKDIDVTDLGDIEVYQEMEIELPEQTEFLPITGDPDD